GIDLALIVAGDPLFDELRLILLSPMRAESQHSLTTRRARYEAVITKPVWATQLYQTIQELQARGAAAAAATPVTQPEAATAPPEPALPLHADRILVVDDNP